jgi:pyruvate-ferredoxin/flavodoxin oxidoreductase
MGGTFLLNSPFSKEETWDQLPKSFQKDLIEKEAEFYIIDASKVALDANLGKRSNTVLQTCFFAIS